MLRPGKSCTTYVELQPATGFQLKLTSLSLTALQHSWTEMQFSLVLLMTRLMSWMAESTQLLVIAKVDCLPQMSVLFSRTGPVPDTRSLHPVSSPHQSRCEALRSWPSGSFKSASFQAWNRTRPLSCPVPMPSGCWQGTMKGLNPGLKPKGGQAIVCVTIASPQPLYTCDWPGCGLHDIPAL